MNEELAQNQWPKVLDEIKSGTAHQSLMAKTMTHELFDKLKDLKTPSGWTLARAINTGTCHPTSFVGCHAGDLESYDMFK
jgi:creatine kinase